jgi:predicted nucleic acid-binding protein
MQPIRHSDKREIAIRLVTSGEAVTSAQIPNEFCNVMKRKFPDVYADVEVALREVNTYSPILPILPLTFEITIQAIAVSKHYMLSFYDSWVIAAASEYGCRAVIGCNRQLA